MNQKRRTRAAIVTAAKDLLAQGVTPTVAQAAEAALVSRTTAYRYFPTQESLLVEVSLNVDVDDLEALVTEPVAAGDAPHRVVEVLDGFLGHVFAAEVQYRTALRLYLDQWLTAVAEGDDAPMVREGRRRRWIETSLAPLRESVGDDEWNRLVVALCVLFGPEAVTVFRDVCQVSPEQARSVSAWAAETLLARTFHDGRRGSP